MKVEVFGEELEIDGSLVEASEAEINRQVKDYVSGERESFDLDFSIPGGFTGEVMEMVLNIPRGETKTYSEVGKELGTAPVAVGQALGRNPLPVMVPCHRVVGKNSPGGYMGREESEVKEKLLRLEQVDF